MTKVLFDIGKSKFSTNSQFPILISIVVEFLTRLT